MSRTSNSKGALPALSRGLRLLEYLSLSEQRSVRFSELKQVLPELTDSTMSRLLQSLEVDGYIKRARGAGYQTGPALNRWVRLLRNRPGSPVEVYRRAVLELVRMSNESAAIALLGEERLTVVASEAAVGAVSVIEAGGTLHFEADHAGSLALLSVLPVEVRRSLLAGPYSHLSDEASFEEACRTLQIDGQVYRDQSVQRPGICRIAMPLSIGDVVAVVFFCLTIESADQNYPKLVQLLKQQQTRVVKELSPLL